MTPRPAVSATTIVAAQGTTPFTRSASGLPTGMTINSATGVITVADSTKIDYETAPGHAYRVTALGPIRLYLRRSHLRDLVVHPADAVRPI